MADDLLDEDNRSSRTTRRRSRGRRQAPTFLEVGPAHGEEEEKAIDDKAKLKVFPKAGKQFDASYVWKRWMRF